MLYGSWGLLQLIKKQGKDIPKFNTHTSSLLKTQKRRPFATGSLPTPVASFFPHPAKGASVKKQAQWQNMTSPQRNAARKKHKDSDGDRVPDIFDCQPQNPFRQDFSESYSGAPAYSYPRSYGYRRRKVEMSPDEYMRLAQKGYRDEESRNMSQEEHYKRVISQSNVDRLKPIIDNPAGKMTIPVLETKRGRILDHEGRHRAIAAKQLGWAKIPVMVVETDKQYIQTRPERKARKWEQEDPDFKKEEEEYEASRALYDETEDDEEDDDE